MMISLINVGVYAEIIEVFTTSQMPVKLNGLPAKVCELDALEGVAHVLNHKMVTTPCSDKEKGDQNNVFMAMYRCQVKASHYELTALPAIVIDKHYVVYGLRAADKALVTVRHYKGAHHA